MNDDQIHTIDTDKYKGILSVEVKASPDVLKVIALGGQASCAMGAAVLLWCMHQQNPVGVYFGGFAMLLSILTGGLPGILRELKCQNQSPSG